MNKIIQARVKVEGRVQGVFFRASTRDKALEVGLCGWVRNLDDGRVEALFEGDEPSVQAALDFVAKGPKFAHVSKLEVETEEVLEAQYDSFRIAAGG